MPLLNLFWKRLLLSVGTVPTGNSTIETGLLLLVVVAIAGPFGWRSGFFRVGPTALSLRRRVEIVVASFVLPALSEEVLFRVLPLPHITEKASPGEKLLWAGVSLFLFVVYHPAKVWLKRSRNGVVFTDCRFLILASLLGLGCTGAYLLSGSLWLPVLIHWMTVAIWLLALGGYDRMREAD